MIAIGIDIANQTFTASACTATFEPVFFGQTFDQTPAGYAALLTLCASIPRTQLQAVMEATGVYSERLSHYLYHQGVAVFVEPPLSIKKGMYEREKSDPVDSRQIAEYAFRFQNRLHPWQPPAEILDQLKTLLTVREQFAKMRTAGKNTRRALQRKQYVHQETQRYYDQFIAKLDGWIADLEHDLEKILQTNLQIQQTFAHVKNIPGVGFLLAVNVALVTEGFTQHLKYQSLSKYIGTCPLSYQSGTSVYRRPRADGAGPSRLRKLLYLSAMRLKKDSPEFRRYFERKVAEGKAPRLILNNLANKLLKIVCGVIKSGKPYIKGYYSINPQLYE